MKIIETTLPYPPSVNHYWDEAIRYIHGRPRILKYVGKRGVAFREEVNALMFKYRHLKFLNEDVFLEINYYPPDRRRRDTDNIQKAILDSLQHASIYTDDYQVAKLLVERKEVRKGGELEIRLTERKK